MGKPYNQELFNSFQWPCCERTPPPLHDFFPLNRLPHTTTGTEIRDAD